MSEIEQLERAEKSETKNATKRSRSRRSQTAQEQPQSKQPEKSGENISGGFRVCDWWVARVEPANLSDFIGWAHRNMTNHSLREIDYLSHDINAILETIQHHTLLVILNMRDGFMDLHRQNRILERARSINARVMFVHAGTMQQNWIQKWVNS